MAVDTAAKRFSMIGFGRPFLKLLVPSGTVDRITLIDLYNGIPLSAVVVAVLGPGFGATTRMSNAGLGFVGLIDNAGNGQIGLIEYSYGVTSSMNNRGIGGVGLMNNDGIGEVGEI